MLTRVRQIARVYKYEGTRANLRGEVSFDHSLLGASKIFENIESDISSIADAQRAQQFAESRPPGPPHKP